MALSFGRTCRQVPHGSYIPCESSLYRTATHKTSVVQGAAGFLRLVCLCSERLLQELSSQQKVPRRTQAGCVLQVLDMRQATLFRQFDDSEGATAASHFRKLDEMISFFA